MIDDWNPREGKLDLGETKDFVLASIEIRAASEALGTTCDEPNASDDVRTFRRLCLRLPISRGGQTRKWSVNSPRAVADGSEHPLRQLLPIPIDKAKRG